MVEKSRLFKRIMELAKRVQSIIDELIGVKGQLADLAEDYDVERHLCIRCGALLDAQGRCPECFERDGAGQSNHHESLPG